MISSAIWNAWVKIFKDGQVSEKFVLIYSKLHEKYREYLLILYIYIIFWCSSRLQMVLIAIFVTALFRMAKSGHTQQAKLASDR